MNDATAPAYFMVQIMAKKLEEAMKRYGKFAIAMIRKFGGAMIAGTPAPKS